jgi:hypothetical protein
MFKKWYAQKVVTDLRPPPLDRRQNLRHDFALRLRADVAFAVQTDGNVSGFHVAVADDEHCVDFRLLGFLNLAVDFVQTGNSICMNHVSPELVHDRHSVAVNIESPLRVMTPYQTFPMDFFHAVFCLQIGAVLPIVIKIPLIFL